MGSESEVVENEITDPNTGETIIQKTPGLLIWLNVTLRRGLTSSTDIWDWRQMVVDGQIDEARVLCSIIAFDQANLEIARWNLTNAWPSKIVVLDTAQGVDYLIEEVVLVHEGIERVS